jgi:acyl-CoA synthetase (AMP-forming)/AMP-acid ligase II
MVISAGMPAAIWAEFEKRFNVKVFEWYGAVEGGLAFKPIGQGPIGSFGKPAPGLDMRVLDENDRECASGEIGEICSRPASGESAEVEYFENADASAQKTRGGWLRSGDMGRRDADGWLFFSHRKGGGIRHNGDFVNAGFVEKLIAEQPSVSDVFVYGVPAASGSPGEKDVVAARVGWGARLDPEDFAVCRGPRTVPSYPVLTRSRDRRGMQRFRPSVALPHRMVSPGPLRLAPSGLSRSEQEQHDREQFAMRRLRSSCQFVSRRPAAPRGRRAAARRGSRNAGGRRSACAGSPGR